MSRQRSFINYILLFSLPLFIFLQSGFSSYANSFSSTEIINENTLSTSPALDSLTFDNVASDSSVGNIAITGTFTDYSTPRKIIVSGDAPYSIVSGGGGFLSSSGGSIANNYTSAGSGSVSLKGTITDTDPTMVQSVDFTLGGFSLSQSNSGVTVDFDMNYNFSSPLFTNSLYLRPFSKMNDSYSYYYLSPQNYYSFLFDVGSSPRVEFSGSSGSMFYYWYSDFNGTRYRSNRRKNAFTASGVVGSGIPIFSGIHVTLYIPPDSSATVTFRSFDNGGIRIIESLSPSTLPDTIFTPDFSEGFVGDMGSLNDNESQLVDSTIGSIKNYEFSPLSSIVGFGTTSTWVGSIMQNIYLNSPFSPAFNILVSLGLGVIVVGIIRLWKGGG